MVSTITFVTGNANKLKEVVAILSDGGATATSPAGEAAPSIVGEYQIINKKLDLEEVQGTIEGVTIHKAAQAATIIDGPVIVEDTCLAFDALNDLPGPYIKWFVDAIGLTGLVKMLVGFEDKGAKAICTFGYCEGPDKPVLLFQGITKGQIVDSRGPTHFGFDSIFEPNGYNETYAQLDPSEKNKISHRYRALDKLKQFLLEGVYSEPEKVSPSSS